MAVARAAWKTGRPNAAARSKGSAAASQLARAAAAPSPGGGGRPPARPQAAGHLGRQPLLGRLRVLSQLAHPGIGQRHRGQLAHQLVEHGLGQARALLLLVITEQAAGHQAAAAAQHGPHVGQVAAEFVAALQPVIVGAHRL